MFTPTFRVAGIWLSPATSFDDRGATAYGYKRQDPYAKLFEDRIVFLGVQVEMTLSIRRRRDGPACSCSSPRTPTATS